MRKSVIAGLTLSAAVMCCAGQPRAYPSHVSCFAADAGVTGRSSGRDRCASTAAPRCSRLHTCVLPAVQSSRRLVWRNVPLPRVISARRGGDCALGPRCLRSRSAPAATLGFLKRNAAGPTSKKKYCMFTMA
jgi:hypothetical protein